jgi:hypothetical protein
MSHTELDQLLGEAVTLSGCARDAMMGAVVLTEDRTPIYLAGMREWNEDIEGEDVEVKGVLQRRSLAPDPVVDEQGNHSHGVEGTNYVLDGASWKRA